MRTEAQYFEEFGITYAQYRAVIDNLLLNNQTTGPNQSEDLVDYTKMNVQRMHRLDKTVHISTELSLALEKLESSYNVLIISEGWCGDAAQILPVIQKIAEHSNGKLNLKIVLRDEHLPLIDQYLTNGGRAIPVVLFMDGEKGEVMAKWGPRPDFLQEKMQIWKTETSDIWELSKWIHTWYAKDKTQSIQEEMIKIISSLH